MNDTRAHVLRSRTRRELIRSSGVGLGAIALQGLLGRPVAAAGERRTPLAPQPPHARPKAKNVIYLHMSGAPPQLDLFDYKPKLVELHMQDCPQELLKNQRFAFIKGVPKLLGTPHKFSRHGRSGAWVTDLLPNFGRHVDEVSFIKSMHTDQFNHAPAELLLYTGQSRFGGAAMGSWITWGLGSENSDLPGFVVLISGGTDPTGGKALWSTGFLPSVYQGVQCRTTGEPILYVNNPAGMDREVRRRSLDALRKINELDLSHFGDPETLTRIEQYELAFRMQMAVPDAMDISREPGAIQSLYGAQPGAASFANNCLLARRLVERGVRYVQLYDWGWDIHGTSPGDDLMTAFPKKCRDVDQAISALLTDLRARGLLDETLVIWGGEFGRTSMNEARGGSKLLGRDHHPHCFTIWMAGAGVKQGFTLGETDELGYFITDGKMSIHDLQATILHLLGLDPFRLTYRYQGLDQRLVGVEGDARVRTELLA